MRVNLESCFFLLLKGTSGIQIGRMPEQDFLRLSNLKVNLLDEGYQVVPWFAVRSCVLPGIDSGQFPALTARQGFDRLLYLRDDGGQGFGRQCRCCG